MKKIALLIALGVFTATPALAQKKQMTYEEAMAYNKKNLSLIVQGLPLILPSWATPIYFGLLHEDAAKDGKKKKRR